jgi:zinc transporter
MYVEQHRVISVRLRRLMAVSDVTGLLNTSHGPRTTGDFLSVVADRLVARMEPVIDLLGHNADSFETQLAALTPPGMRAQLRGLRHTAIILRRYLTPQRDIMARLQLEQYEWLSQHNRIELREVADRVTRYIEELDEVRERSALLQDELVNQLTETANRTIYLLTVVAALMLPLSFLTGLLGINVGGIPGTDSPAAFWIVCLLLLLFGVGQLWLFRKLRWI